MIEKRFENIQIEYKTGELFKNHTYYDIGGGIRIMAFPKDEKELCLTLDACREERIPYFILGKGSNILVSDEGYCGCVIDMTKYFLDISVSGNLLRAQCGITMSAAAGFAQAAGLSGLEKLSGIPGTLGGAVMMNAGCYNSEISQVIKEIRVIDEDLRPVTLKRDEIRFGYRSSGLGGKIVTEAVLELVFDDKNRIRKTMYEMNLKRIEKQPYNYPSCGSVFKRPEGYFAGKLIEDCGLKGITAGGAAISELHAGFIVNKGGAKAEDVLDLIRTIKEKVLSETGVKLEEEVVFLGFKQEEAK
jgi:UDP-N-acetylmuramate dehydrogenase